MKTRRFCPKCGRPVVKSKNKEYTFQCYNCDEDFCRFEVYRKKDLAQVLQIRKDEFEYMKSRGGIIQSLKKPFHKYN
jgi:NADH pyrophosphatase NudC (nudix superfamily)